MSPSRISVVLASAAALALAAPAFAAPDAAGNLPYCSATVTDNCMQRSEAPRPAKHKAVRHHAKTHRVAKKHTAKSKRVASAKPVKAGKAPSKPSAKPTGAKRG